MSVEMLEHEPLARYTGWRIGGPAHFFANARTRDDLVDLVRWAGQREVPILMLGGGTNILIGDGGYPGLVIRNRATGTELDDRGDEVIVRAESGAPMAGTARRLAGQGFAGLVWAEGLPGTVGGAVYGNAGCYGGDTAGNLIDATVLLPNGEIEEWSQERLGFGYRTSVLKAAQHAAPADPRTPGLTHPVVLAARLRLERGDRAELAAQMAEIAAGRRSKTPSGSSCGSSFKNPPGTSAGRLLDEAGLKGTRVGGAVVSERHANYIVNEGGATAADVLRLLDIMRERVLQVSGIELELEVQLVGEPGQPAIDHQTGERR
jgi:UDP-N-acetylmuramate dehydrogenase